MDKKVVNFIFGMNSEEREEFCIAFIAHYRTQCEMIETYNKVLAQKENANSRYLEELKTDIAEHEKNIAALDGVIKNYNEIIANKNAKKQ